MARKITFYLRLGDNWQNYNRVSTLKSSLNPERRDILLLFKLKLMNRTARKWEVEDKTKNKRFLIYFYWKNLLYVFHSEKFNICSYWWQEVIVIPLIMLFYDY